MIIIGIIGSYVGRFGLFLKLCFETTDWEINDETVFDCSFQDYMLDSNLLQFKF